MTEETTQDISKMIKQKVDKLYETEIYLEDIKESPILHAILKVKDIYETQSLTISRAVSDYKTNIDYINEMIKNNPTYSTTTLMTKVQMLMKNSEQIIHSQDLQREYLKSAVIEMLDINKKYYTKNEEYKKIEPPKQQTKVFSETENTDLPKEKKKRGRPPKQEIETENLEPENQEIKQEEEKEEEIENFLPQNQEVKK